MAVLAEQQLSSELGKLTSTQTFRECLAQVHAVLDIYQVGHGCLHSLGDPLDPDEALWRVTPEDVTSACSALVSLKKHPAIIIGRGKHFPFNLFDYRDQFQVDPDVELLYEAFENNGLTSAYGLPIQAESGTYVFVVGRPGGPIGLTELLALQTICSNAINKIVQFKQRPCERQVPRILTPEQRHVLIAVAKGMGAKTIGRYLDLHEDLVATMRDQIVDTLGAANVRHAIVLALIAGELTLEDCAPDQPKSIVRRQ